MQYPELNIGEFAIKNSADVELEKDENEEGYLLMVNAEPGEEQEGYPVSIGARPQSVEQLGEIFERQFTDYPFNEDTTVYGNNRDAIQATAGRGTWARFERPIRAEKEREYRQIVSESVPEAREDIMNMEDPDYRRLLDLEREGRDRTGLTLYIKKNMEDEGIEEGYQPKGWAVDIEPLIKGRFDQYDEFAERISAATLHVINRAESEGEVGPDLQDFHYDIIKDLRPGEEPIVIDVEEETTEKTIDETEIQDKLDESAVDEKEGYVSSEKQKVHSETEIDYKEVAGDLSELTIPRAKRLVKEVEDRLDEEEWSEIRTAEEEGRDRITFKSWLNDRQEQEDT